MAETVPSGGLDAVAVRLAERIGSNGDFLERALNERIAPLLYYELHERWPSCVPEAARSGLRHAYYRSAAHNLEHLDTLASAARALASEGIRSVAFKGAVLAERLYESLGERPMGDVDLYVSPTEAERAEQTLERAGFRPWCPDMTYGLSRRIRHARLYVGGANDAQSLDLHWSLVGHADDRRAPERDWVESNVEDVPARSYSRLNDSAHLLYAAAHMKLQHYDEAIPLLWLVDLYQLAWRVSLESDAWRNDAERMGWDGALRAALRDVRSELDVDLPDELQAFASERRTASVLSESDGLHQPDARTRPERVWNELRTMSWRSKLSLARALVLPSPDYLRFRYRPQPTWTWPLCYFRRWWDIARNVIGVARGKLARSESPKPLLAPPHREESC